MPAQLNEEASDKVLEVEQQYSKLRRPIYDRRRELLKHIPNFWMHTFLHHPEFAQAATDDDEKILSYCTDVCTHGAMHAPGMHTYACLIT